MASVVDWMTKDGKAVVRDTREVTARRIAPDQIVLDFDIAVESLAGDVFLMLPRERFVAGLVCFLFAHLCYIVAFTTDGARTPSVWGAAVLVLYGTLMLRLLWPHLGKLKAPVSVYVAAILLMVWQALNRWMATGDAGSALALAGALLFVTSDSTLAWNRFRDEFRSAQVVVLGTYFAAQWLIALST